MKEPVTEHIPPVEDITEADFEPQKPLEATADDDVMELADADLEDVDEASEVREKLKIPFEIQKEKLVEAQTFRSSNGIEGGISLQKKRERTDADLNQDCVLIYEDEMLGTGYGVFDGLGGEGEKSSGAFASAKAVEVLPRHLEEAHRNILGSTVRKEFAKLSLIKLNEKTQEAETAKAEDYITADLEVMKKAVAIREALKRSNEDVRETEGKTTACFTLMHTTKDGKRFAITANIGDGGAILRRKDGSISMLTKEDGALTMYIEKGFLGPSRLELMKAEPTKEFDIAGKMVTYDYLKRANTQVLGSSIGVEPRITITELEDGDEVFNVTDGILDFFEDENGDFDQEALRGALKGKTLQERINRLREIADVRSKIKKTEKGALKDTDDMAIAAMGYAKAA